MAFHYQSIINLFSLMNLTDRVGGSVCCKEKMYSNLMNECPWGHRSLSAFLWALCVLWSSGGGVSPRVWYRFCSVVMNLLSQHPGSWDAMLFIRAVSPFKRVSVLTNNIWHDLLLSWLIYMDRELLLLHQHKTSLKNQSCVHIIMQSTWDSNAKPA